MSRIDTTFQNLKHQNQKAFIAYLAAGDPDYDSSLATMKVLADEGVDIIELGLPFSDPLADGIVNQMAANRALEAGMTSSRVLDLIRDFRITHQTPIVLFAYLNPIFAYGFKAFHHDAAQAGADGILLLDLPQEEAQFNDELSEKMPLQSIRLVSPTTPKARVSILASGAEGFIYALSRTGVTGAHGAPSADAKATIERIREFTTTPICIGFGISTAEQVEEMVKLADGVIVGSAIVKQMELNPSQAAEAVRKFVQPLIQAAKKCS